METIENKPLISVIIPVYNVEKYLNECVDSIINQKMKDFEIILVDDGSKDKSGEICDDYAQKHEFIKVVHKENGGASSARNRGIREANGEYLVFMDSDDFYKNGDFFTKVSKIIEKSHPDGILHPITQIKPNMKDYMPVRAFDDKVLDEYIKYSDIIIHLMKTSSFPISACSIVLRRKLIIERDLFFIEGITCEDIDWGLRLFSKELSLKFLSEYFYVYRSAREGSVTNTIKNTNLQTLFDIVSQYADKYKKSDDEIEKILLNYVSYQYVILCGLLVKAEDASFVKSMKKKLNCYKWLLNYDMFGKVKKPAVIGKIFGIDTLCFVLGKYIKYR